MEIDYEKTVTGLTYTSDGEIPHYLFNGILCPVKLARIKYSNGYGIVMQNRHPVPKYQNRRLVFALPNGGEIIP